MNTPTHMLGTPVDLPADTSSSSDSSRKMASTNSTKASRIVCYIKRKEYHRCTSWANSIA